MTLIQILNKEAVPWEEMETLDRIRDKRISDIDNLRTPHDLKAYCRWVGMACYNYGVIMGKRMERARRKRNQQ